MPATVVRRCLCAVLLAGALLSACGGENPYQTAQTAAGTDNEITNASGDGTGGNEFMPARENVTECIGAVERPNCGSKSNGGWRMYLTFGVLIAGMSFIGWRVVRGVRSGDAQRAEP